MSIVESTATRTATRDWLWSHLLDADLNRRYWRCLAERYKKFDQSARILLALVSSGVVAAWTIWNQYPAVWQALSAVSAVVAIALPILNFPSSVEIASDLHGRWTELYAEYERLWVTLQDGMGELTEAQMRALLEKENNNASKEATMPTNKRLAAQCQAEVLKRWSRNG